LLCCLLCGGVRLALHARSYFLQDPCCAAVFVCAVAVAPLFARSTDVLKKRLRKRAISSDCFARASVGVGGGLGIRDTIQVFDAAETVAALNSGSNGLGGDASRPFLQLRCLRAGIASICLVTFCTVNERHQWHLHARCTHQTVCATTL